MYRILKFFIGFCLVMLNNNIYAASSCKVTLHSDDQIRWDIPIIKVSKTCQTFTITLVHEGKLSKDVMGHNWLLTRTKDKNAVVKAMISAKSTGFVKDDGLIIAHTGLIGGGEQTSVSLDVNQLVEGQKYSYFCSYPEHSDLMQGTLILID